jgi:hypothetical protein
MNRYDDKSNVELSMNLYDDNSPKGKLNAMMVKLAPGVPVGQTKSANKDEFLKNTPKVKYVQFSHRRAKIC